MKICCWTLSQLLHSDNRLKFFKHCIYCYFSFLRLSNILPHATAGFDVTRHSCVGDVIFSFTGTIIVVKWSKTIQDRVSTATVVIPYLGNSPLCPVSAIRTMLSGGQSQTDKPLFQIQVSECWKDLTVSVARKHLKRVSSILALPRSLIFHDFRRGGATWAFLKGVPTQQIQAQGTWSSSCVWRYINLPPSAASQVSRTFQAHLSS